MNRLSIGLVVVLGATAWLSCEPTGLEPTLAFDHPSVTFIDTVGTSNPASQIVSVTNSGGGSLSGLSVDPISYGAGASGWLTATLSGTTAPTTLTLSANLSGLAPGTYTGTTVPITSGVASNSPQLVSVTFVVVPATVLPAIVLNPTSVTFTDTIGTANPPAKPVNVTNGGGGLLTGLAVDPISYGPGASGWLTATLNATTAPATLTLLASLSGLSAGTYTATVPITSSVASNSPQPVSVTFVVVPATVPPAIVLNPTSVTFTDTIGTANPSAKTVTVTNGGGGLLTGLAVDPISYSAGASGWLTATLSGTTAPTTLTLSASLSGLSAGTYTATLPITSSVASNSPQPVSVTFVVVAGPAIVLNPTSVTFTDTIGTANPSAKTVTVTNGGGGLLTGLAVDSISYGPGASGWLTATLNATTAPATLTLLASLSGLSAGTYTATVPITSSVASNSPQPVSVTFVVVPVVPDLMVSILTAPSIGYVGETVAMSMQAPNQGTGDAGAFRVGFYWSTNTTITTGDIFSGRVCSYPTGLPAGVIAVCTDQVTVPDSLLPGTYYLGAIADDLGQVAESNENNNTRSAGPISIQRRDYSIGGTVTGLVGVGCVLQNNGGDDLSIFANGPFTFPTLLPNGSPYNVTVGTPPTGPTQSCTISNGTGIVSGANVSNIAVSCSVVRPPCSNAQSLSSVSGDQPITGARGVAGDGEAWFRVRVTEDDASPGGVPITAAITLTVPSGVDYDLFVYCVGCGGTLAGSSLNGTGVTDSVLVRWEDRFLIDDDADILIQVRYFSGSSAERWNLQVRGFRPVTVTTCTL